MAEHIRFIRVKCESIALTMLQCTLTSPSIAVTCDQRRISAIEYIVIHIVLRPTNKLLVATLIVAACLSVRPSAVDHTQQLDRYEQIRFILLVVR